MVRRKNPVLLKKGKGYGKIPMSGLRQLAKAGAYFQKKTGTVDTELKKIRKEIRQRARK